MFDTPPEPGERYAGKQRGSAYAVWSFRNKLRSTLATGRVPEGAEIQFTFFWPGEDRWEGVDFKVQVERGKH